MCKHILNAQVAIRAPCCRRWFDCPQCHAESQDHELEQSYELTLACKKCKKVFRIDMREGERDEADEYCPHCDNHYVLEAVTPEDKAELRIEAEEGKESEMIRDTRDHNKERRRQHAMEDADFLTQHIKKMAAQSDFNGMYQ
ncbi:CHY zinc finger [Carpediemonas membranifera]|uniref:CHY zinc finger n=1 Tax=Carpediemonas membranifera TaxID=201153 RepID=A0A8J6AZH3_9EUKA|nr:CHY zinc finger [Carpediemonas membranifera]|eukprot:KAG9391024.1 CHY zinc finger [Carpediemonas membranifera]